MPDAHLIDQGCTCPDCTKIDVVYGDPYLNPWERRFVESLAEFGWRANYSQKQQAKLNQVWTRLRRLRLGPEHA